MSVKAVVGMQWGDEGKGKIVDILSEDADLVIRFQGGDNAGHTVVNDKGSFKLHLIPCGVFYDNVNNLIGTWSVVNPDQLLTEMKQLEDANISLNRLFISDKANIIMPYHTALDALNEKTKNGIGTTKKGIGPAYSGKMLRNNIRMEDLADPDYLRERLEAILPGVNNQIAFAGGTEKYDVEALMAKCAEWYDALKRFIINPFKIVHTYLKEGRKILFEGQLGVMKDIDLGIYPYVTSSHPTAAYACVSSGIPPKSITGVIGIMKAFSTAVGAGPFPAETLGHDADILRGTGENIDDEFGATTGRARRIGWLDLPVVKYAHEINGFTEVVINKIDKLDALDKIKVCTAYKLDGKVIDYMPSSRELYKVEPVFIEVDGWKTNTRNSVFVFACGKDENPPIINEKTYTLEELNAAINSLTFLQAVSYTFTMPKLPTSYENVTLLYESDKPESISVAGIVVRSLEDVAVKITATVSWKDLSVSKDFNITVRSRTRTDVEKVDYVFETLELDGLSNIESDLTLPITDRNGYTTLTWLSDHPYITNSGKVTKPEYPSQDITGNIYVIITSGTVQRVKSFSCTVLAKNLLSVALKLENLDYYLSLEDGKAVIELSGKIYRIKTGTLKSISLKIESKNKSIKTGNLLENQSGYDEGEFSFKYIFGEADDLVSGENAEISLVSRESNDKMTATGEYLLSGVTAFSTGAVTTEEAEYRFLNVTEGGKHTLKITKNNRANFYFYYKNIENGTLKIKGTGEINDSTQSNSRYRIFKLILTNKDTQIETEFTNIVAEGGNQFEFSVNLDDINLSDYNIKITISESADDGIFNNYSRTIEYGEIT
ncbi:adenylosuccinate synthetase [Holotrichia oblita]|nr:adenylosuccinate synthetase [Holotrichia oblita]